MKKPLLYILLLFLLLCSFLVVAFGLGLVMAEEGEIAFLFMSGFLSIIAFIIYQIGTPDQDYKPLPGGEKYAGLWARFAAGFLDGLVLSLGLIVLEYMFMGEGSSEIIMGEQFDPSFEFFSYILSWLYFCLLQSSKEQATYGMRILGIKIYDERFNRVGFWRLTVRYLLTFYSGIILGIGFLMIGWTKRKQGLHDFAVRTIHLRKNK